jgi:uncharacterized hydrophobic protein (TIGR00271 family)
MKLLQQFRHFGQRIALRSGTDVEGTIGRVTAGASLTPENLWLLACSAILASIGLDVSSAAVIIGAMLISPLMGPILGVGLGIGITDRELLQRSIRELGLATIFTIAVSAAYFVISPLAVPTSEMIARTRPTLLDVAVAFFGGVAGIVAGSRKQQSLALPGVAIATALMPPLCTAGFGLATGNWAFFLGAFYLYALNAVFIALSTFLMVRILRFPHHEAASTEARQRERRMVAIVAVIATLPSMYFLYDAVRGVRERKRITDFVQQQVVGPGRAVPQWEHEHDRSGEVLKIYVAGHPIDSAGIDSLQAALPDRGLRGMRLEIVQSDVSVEDLRRFRGDVQRDLLRAMSNAFSVRDSASRLSRRLDSLRISTAARELVRAFPEIEALSYTPQLNLLSPDSVPVRPAFFVRFTGETRAETRRQILARAAALLRQRLAEDSLEVLER